MVAPTTTPVPPTNIEQRNMVAAPKAQSMWIWTGMIPRPVSGLKLAHQTTSTQRRISTKTTAGSKTATPKSREDWAEGAAPQSRTGQLPVIHNAVEAPSRGAPHTEDPEATREARKHAPLTEGGAEEAPPYLGRSPDTLRGNNLTPTPGRRPRLQGGARTQGQVAGVDDTKATKRARGARVRR